MGEIAQVLQLTGMPASRRVFEQGIFVYRGQVNEKPCYSCAFKFMGYEDYQEYSIWWARNPGCFIFGPSAAKGTGSGLMYVPGEGAADPTKVSMQWVVNDEESGDWKVIPRIRAVEVVTYYDDDNEVNRPASVQKPNTEPVHANGTSEEKLITEPVHANGTSENLEVEQPASMSKPSTESVHASVGLVEKANGIQPAQAKSEASLCSGCLCVKSLVQKLSNISRTAAGQRFHSYV